MNTGKIVINCGDSDERCLDLLTIITERDTRKQMRKNRLNEKNDKMNSGKRKHDIFEDY